MAGKRIHQGTIAARPGQTMAQMDAYILVETEKAFLFVTENLKRKCWVPKSVCEVYRPSPISQCMDVRYCSWATIDFEPATERDIERLEES